MKIGDREFQFVPYNAQGFRRYQSILRAMAQEGDQPVARFAAKLGGLSAEDRAAAIRGFINSPGWDDPDPKRIAIVSNSYDGCLVLAKHVLQPVLPYEEIILLITEDNYRQVYEQLVDALQEHFAPTDDQIRERNKVIKERFQAAQEAACQSSTPKP